MYSITGWFTFLALIFCFHEISGHDDIIFKWKKIQTCQQNQLGLELEFNNNCAVEKVCLDKIQGTTCGYIGKMQESSITVTSMNADCSSPQISFQHSCTKYIMFDGDNAGNGRAHIPKKEEPTNGVQNNGEDMKIPPIPDLSNLGHLKRDTVIFEDHYELKLKIIYDTNFNSEFGADSVQRIESVMAHVQTLYLIPSIPMQIHLNVMSIEYRDDLTLEASGDKLDELKPWLITEAANGQPQPHLYVFMTFQNNAYGTTGIAWVGTACYGIPELDRADITSSINEYFNTDLDTAEIVAHEIGHNLNMSHDFMEIISTTEKVERFHEDGSSCTWINGIMDYYVPAEIWTKCSVSDLRYMFEWLDGYGLWCLDRYTDTTPPTTPPTTPTTTPPSGPPPITTTMPPGNCTQTTPVFCGNLQHVALAAQFIGQFYNPSHHYRDTRGMQQQHQKRQMQQQHLNFIRQQQQQQKLQMQQQKHVAFNPANAWA